MNICSFQKVNTVLWRQEVLYNGKKDRQTSSESGFRTCKFDGHRWQSVVAPRGWGGALVVGGGLAIQWKFQGWGSKAKGVLRGRSGMDIFWNCTIAFGAINIAMQNHRNIRVSEKIRDGFSCSSKCRFAHPEPKKRRRPSLENTDFSFSQPYRF